jgi:hypothetical protein
VDSAKDDQRRREVIQSSAAERLWTSLHVERCCGVEAGEYAILATRTLDRLLMAWAQHTGRLV